ncbi:MAG: hypothetical protein ACTHQQ_14660 [Solirubrobacteraceae bacterium]
MKLQATIIVSNRADSLAEAGEKLDEVLLRARARRHRRREHRDAHAGAGRAVTLP